MLHLFLLVFLIPSIGTIQAMEKLEVESGVPAEVSRARIKKRRRKRIVKAAVVSGLLLTAAATVGIISHQNQVVQVEPTISRCFTQRTTSHLDALALLHSWPCRASLIMPYWHLDAN